MRDELHLMESADRYLENAMTAAERADFEAGLAANAELRELLDEQRALREGLQRLHLRGAITRAYRGYVFRKWLPWAIGSLVVLGLLFAGGRSLQHGLLEERSRPALDSTIATDVPVANDDTARATVTITHHEVVDTVYMIVKDGKRIRVDSIPKGARIIGTEVHQRVDTLRVPQMAVETQKEPFTSSDPGSVPVAPTSSTPGQGDNGINYLSTSRNAKPDSTGAEMHISRPKDAESQPMFPGGFDAMYAFLKKSIIVPIGLKKEGTVVVSFVVDEQGGITDSRVEQSVSKACDKEAMRVVQSMPNWIPCQADGKPVRSRIEVPLKFAPGPVEARPVELSPQLQKRLIRGG